MDSCEIQYKCKHCDNLFAYDSEHLIYLKTDTGETQCICSQCTKGLNDLITHKITHMDSEMHECNQCDQAFRGLINLGEHLVIHNNEETHRIQYEIQNHKLVRKTDQFSQCDVDFTFNNDLILFKRIQTNEKPYKCSQCGMVSIDRYSFMIHLLIHASGKPSGKPYQCGLCEKAFANKIHLAGHLGSHYYDEKPQQCGQCDMAFSSKTNLMKHKESHKGKKTYQCGRCDKSFVNRRCFVRHLRSHTGGETLQCVQCDMAFSCKANLTKHIRFIHDGNQLSQGDTAYAIKMHQCRQCLKTFTCIEELKTHRMIHYDRQPYKCIHCDKHFSFIGDSISHLRTHILERLYQCNYCENSFTCNDQLLIHMANHTLEKAFQCEICHNLFKERIALVKHIQTHKENFINAIFDINEGNVERKINNSENVSRPEFGVIEAQNDGENCDEKDLFDLKVEIKEESLNYEQSESTFDKKIKGLKRENENDGDHMFTTIWNEIKVEVKVDEIDVTN